MPPSPVHNGNSDICYETMNTTEALQDLDEFLDLLSSNEKPQDSVPSDDPSHGEGQNNDSNARGFGFPRYYLPTGSPWQTGHGGRIMGGVSPPAYSMPDLTMNIPYEEEEEQEMRRILPAAPYSTQQSLPSHPPNQQQQQQRHTDTSSGMRGSEKARQKQCVDQSGCGYNQWDSQDGGVQTYNPSPTRRRVSEGERRCPSPLAMTSYTSREARYARVVSTLCVGVCCFCHWSAHVIAASAHVISPSAHVISPSM